MEMINIGVERGIDPEGLNASLLPPVETEAEVRQALRAVGVGEVGRVEPGTNEDGEPARGSWLVETTWEALGDQSTYAHPSALAIEKNGYTIWMPTY